MATSRGELDPPLGVGGRVRVRELIAEIDPDLPAVGVADEGHLVARAPGPQNADTAGDFHASAHYFRLLIAVPALNPAAS